MQGRHILLVGTKLVLEQRHAAVYQRPQLLGGSITRDKAQQRVK